MVNLKHTKIGIISIIITLIIIVYIVMQSIIDIFISTNVIDSSSTIINYIILNLFFLISSIGFVLGVIGIFQKNSRKAFPIISVIVNGIISISFIITLFKNIA